MGQQSKGKDDVLRTVLYCSLSWEEDDFLAPISQEGGNPRDIVDQIP